MYWSVYRIQCQGLHAGPLDGRVWKNLNILREKNTIFNTLLNNLFFFLLLMNFYKPTHHPKFKSIHQDSFLCTMPYYLCVFCQAVFLSRHILNI